jgi:predicted metal-dependent HD superfamily phosphohydrolase
MQLLISDVSLYVLELLTNKLPSTLTFHNVAHTLDVVEGVHEICLQTGVPCELAESVEIAAWFHDTGYLNEYIGHEEVSVQIAKQFLTERGVPEAKIKEIAGCIYATKYPQKPRNFLEKIICDADFYHFTFPDYLIKSNLLRAEWEFYLDKSFTDANWNKENCSMLNSHKYFTEYGRNTFQVLKESNMMKSSCILENYIESRQMKGDKPNTAA